MRDEVGSHGPASSAFFLPEVVPVTSAVWLALGAMFLLELVNLVQKRDVAKLWGSDMWPSGQAARREYSWISPPSRSRRTITPAGWTCCGRPRGGRRPSARCGRAAL